MGAPIRIYQYYSDAELAIVLAELKDQTANGSITATGGAGKSSSQEFMSLEDRWLAYNLERQIRSGIAPPQKVTQITRPGCGVGYLGFP